MRVTVITVLPELVDAYASASVLGRARAAGIFSLDVLQLRDFATDKHRSVDDTPAGGGAGMVLKVDVVAAAVRRAIADGDALGIARTQTRIVFLDARGEVFAQPAARRTARTADHLVLVCGRYEGFDHRCFTVDYGAPVALLSVGDVVLTGGELAALVVLDAVVRLLPGALGNDASAAHESHADAGLLEHRHYTRPVAFEGQAIPPVLLSGDHRNIARARLKDGVLLTRAQRPELLVRRDRRVLGDKALDKLMADARVPALAPAVDGPADP
jgi:tRNA (guanine37-N1)-methyltransferase